MKQQSEFEMHAILTEAIQKPGKLMEAYRAFHSYSLNNILLAMWQCQGRGIEISPVATFKQWQEKGRQVKKGEKAIALLMPVTIKDKTDENKTFTKFITRNNWFALSQTEGEEYKPETLNLNGYDKKASLKHFEVNETSFAYTNGNAQGYATAKGELAINPMAQIPHKTFFHELAHCAFHFKDCDLTQDKKEVEAECISLLCLEALGLEGAEYCRGYIVNWLQGNSIDETWAKSIIKKTNLILKAGVTT